MRMPYVIVGEARSVADLQDAMDALTRINVGLLRRYDVPPLLMSGVVYERERRGGPLPGVERFQTAVDAYRLGHSDCDGLAPWMAAELTLEGVRCRARVIPSPGIGYHVLVQTSSGRIVDPSALLGMLDGVGEDVPEDAQASAEVRRERRGRRFARIARGLIQRAVRAGVRSTGGRAVLRAGVEAAEHASALLERPRGVIDVEERA